ncbi:MAG: carboxymethylenebutenolidase [Rhodospirillaceae bacterium]|nr:carboxymethylenebutenolidase [Rhodospirillaceae bacterium]
MNSSEINISSKDGDFMGYLASPSEGGPGIIVLQEIFGVNSWLRGVCDMFAKEGYMALAPDLFWRQQAGIQLDPTNEADFAKGLEIYGEFDVDKSVQDIQASIDNLRNNDKCNGKVGSTGFCLGGLLSYLTAARTNSNANSGYYGVGIEGLLNEANNITTPLMLHIASEDSFVPKDVSEKICSHLNGYELINTFIYKGCDHGFARDTDPSHYNPEATKIAHSRTLDLFNKELQ